MGCGSVRPGRRRWERRSDGKEPAAIDRVGSGIIGARFAAEVHARALGKLRDGPGEIVAVPSRTQASAEAFVRKFRSPYVSTDPRAWAAPFPQPAARVSIHEK